MFLYSISEQSDLEHFSSIAELANRNFRAERRNIQIVSDKAMNGLTSFFDANKQIEWEEKLAKMRTLINQVTIPRRPPWDSSMSAEELDIQEKESFLEWRRSLVT
jgi:large subunit GTPase 1